MSQSPGSKIGEAGREFGMATGLLLGALFIVLSIVMTFSSLYREFGTRRTEVVKILEIDAPRTCVSRRSRGILGLFSPGQQRSSVPETVRGTGMYCGSILTDRGTFRLPETGSLALWNDDREAIVDGIRPGCTYSAVVVGSYYGFQNVMPPPNTLVAIKRERRCD